MRILGHGWSGEAKTFNYWSLRLSRYRAGTNRTTRSIMLDYVSNHYNSSLSQCALFHPSTHNHFVLAHVTDYLVVDMAWIRNSSFDNFTILSCLCQPVHAAVVPCTRTSAARVSKIVGFSIPLGYLNLRRPAAIELVFTGAVNCCSSSRPDSCRFLYQIY